MPSVYFKHRNIVLLSLISFAIGCGPTYQSVRLHVPHQTKAEQLQIEATLPEEINGDTFNTQIDTSYSLTDNFIVSGGLIYQTFASSGIDERYAGIHLGAGYHLPINDWFRSTSLAGVGLQTWSWDEDQSNLDEDYSLGFDSFDASIVAPFAQTSLIFGSRRTNVSASLRIETPTFQFRNTAGALETGYAEDPPIEYDRETQLYSLASVVQLNLGLGDHWGLFGQIVNRNISGIKRTTGIEAEFAALYLGVSYMTGED